MVKTWTEAMSAQAIGTFISSEQTETVNRTVVQNFVAHDVQFFLQQVFTYSRLMQLSKEQCF